jgi:mannose-6-phosphate isomerase-like protein (cupin superfamily)
MKDMADETTTTNPVWVLGHRVTSIRCGGRFVALEVATPVGTPGPPPHHHEDCTEFFYVIAGRLGVMRSGEWITLEAGEHAEVSRGVVHTFRNDGDEDARMITGFDPHGFEAFFEEYGVDATEPGGREASTSPEMIQRVIDGCSRFGMIIAPDALEGRK